MAALRALAVLAVLSLDSPAMSLFAANKSAAKHSVDLRDDGIDDDFGYSNNTHLPPSFPHTMACPRNQPKEVINQCIKTNLLAMIPYMSKGNKVGLPNLEPYYVPKIKTHFKSYIVDFHAVFSRMTASGLSGISVLDARADLKDDSMDIEVDIFLPKMSFDGHFELVNAFFSMSGFKFQGKGPFSVSFPNITATWRFKGNKQPGSEYMVTSRTVPEYTVGGMKFWAENLVEGFPFLDDLIITIVNRLWKEVVQVGKPAVESALAEHIWLMSSPVFRRIPYDSLFPPA